MPELATVRAYHQRSKHALQRYAAGPDTLDWDAQPDPWRRYTGAATLPLPLLQPGSLPARWDQLGRDSAKPPQPCDLASLAALLQLSLGLSAWKTQGPDRWAVRHNPSSGNLHPTEAYVLARGWPGLADGLHHYAPREHALVQRAALHPPAQAQPPADAPMGLWVGLSSIHWREAWKYGERAFRYCQLDLGHALGALRYAAAVLGWHWATLPELPHPTLAALLGLDRAQDFADVEPEEAELLLQLLPGPGALPSPVPAPTELHGWAGRPNRLDAHPMYRWPVIDEVARASRRVAGAPLPHVAPDSPASADHGDTAPVSAPAPEGPGPCAATVIQQRRSAQRFERRAPMAGQVLQALAQALLPSAARPWDLADRKLATPAQRPRVHPVFFVHRVDGLAPGAYLLPRGAGAMQRLAPAMSPQLLWQPVPGSPLRLLTEHPALAGTLRTLCCHQALASDANLALTMLGEFDAALAAQGPSGYRSLLQEAGLMGQVLYLQAEAMGHRGTGIGCFFDDALHELLGITDTRLQALYHFTVGTAMDDPRIGSAPPYADLASCRQETPA